MNYSNEKNLTSESPEVKMANEHTTNIDELTANETISNGIWKKRSFVAWYAITLMLISTIVGNFHSGLGALDSLSVLSTLIISSLRKETAKHTLRCLIGCNIGEVIGAAIGFAFGMDMTSTLILAIGLAFTVGYAFAMIPMLSHTSILYYYIILQRCDI